METLNWLSLILVGFVIGFSVCMFLGLLVTYYIRNEENRNNVLSNLNDKKHNRRADRRS